VLCSLLCVLGYIIIAFYRKQQKLYKRDSTAHACCVLFNSLCVDAAICILRNCHGAARVVRSISPPVKCCMQYNSPSVLYIAELLCQHKRRRRRRTRGHLFLLLQLNSPPEGSIHRLRDQFTDTNADAAAAAAPGHLFLLLQLNSPPEGSIHRLRDQFTDTNADAAAAAAPVDTSSSSCSSIHRLRDQFTNVQFAAAGDGSCTSRRSAYIRKLPHHDRPINRALPKPRPRPQTQTQTQTRIQTRTQTQTPDPDPQDPDPYIPRPKPKPKPKLRWGTTHTTQGWVRKSS
jgi:hypothetical protein